MHVAVGDQALRHAACFLGGARDIGFCPRRNISMMRIGPPQQGHGSRKVSGMISASGSEVSVGFGRWVHSNARIFMILVLRLELASNP